MTTLGLKRDFENSRPPHYTNHRIEIGDWELSIQCSEYHYCQPRVSMADPEAYEQYEVAVFFKGLWVLDCPFMAEHGEPLWFADDGTLQSHNRVAGYVDKDNVAKLVAWCKETPECKPEWLRPLDKAAERRGEEKPPFQSQAWSPELD